MAVVSLSWNINMKSIENTLLLTHNRTPWRQNSTVESFRFEDNYEDEIWLKIFFVFLVVVFVFLLFPYFLIWSRSFQFHVFTRGDGTVIFREKKPYCAFHKHADSKVQKPPSQLRFSLPSIIITITSNGPWNTETHKTNRNPPITNQKPWPAKTVSWLLNFRIPMFVKSAVSPLMITCNIW